MMTGSRPMVAAFDLLTSLLLIFVILALVSSPKQKTSQIDTLGTYAVIIRWPDGSNDDVDLYVRDPQGHIVYFASRDEGLMHLEHDDRGTLASGAHQNGERVIFRGMVKGEYTANVHMYLKEDKVPIEVTVELWRLRGNDKLLTSKTVMLTRMGQEETAFRFDEKGRGRGDLPRKFVGSDFS